MRSILLLGAVAVGLVLTDPAICAQTMPTPGSQPTPGEPAEPSNPNPMPDPANPMPPVTDPLPPEMPMPAGEAQDVPPTPDTPPTPETPPAPGTQVIDRSLPPGPSATPPSAGMDRAVSGATNTTMMTPQPSTKTYPPCSRTVQDNCRNPGEGPKRR